jgi:hypothetical protein
MLAASSTAFATPLSETVAIDGGNSAITQPALDSGDLASNDQALFSSSVADDSARSGILITSESRHDSLSDPSSGPMKAAPTPEPTSLMLLGTSLVGAAGMVMRRRRAVA